MLGHPIEHNAQFQEEETELLKRANDVDSLIRLQPKPRGYQLELVRGKYDEFRTSLLQWDQLSQPWAVRRDQKYLDAVHRCYDDLTKYLEQEERYKYINLLAYHICRCIFRPSNRPLQAYSAEEEIVHSFREMEKIGDDMAKAGIVSKEEAIEDWIVMMFRACFWGACHSFVAGEKAPAACYGSQLPVYIG